MWLNRRDTKNVGLPNSAKYELQEGKGEWEQQIRSTHTQHRYSKVGKGRGKAEVRENINTRTE